MIWVWDQFAVFDNSFKYWIEPQFIERLFFECYVVQFERREPHIHIQHMKQRLCPDRNKPPAEPGSAQTGICHNQLGVWEGRADTQKEMM